MARVVSADPAAVPGPLDRETEVAILANPPPSRILCVDDEPAILAMLVRALSPEFEVVALDDPVAALALVEHGRFAVIMSDMRMPTMTGTAFLERAKSLSPSSTRLALTAGLDWQLPEDVAFGVLTKPCPVPLLQATVSAAAQCHALSAARSGVERRGPEEFAAGDRERGTVSGYRLDRSPSPLALGRGHAVESGLRPRGAQSDASKASTLVVDPSSVPLPGPRRLALSLLGSVVELGPRATLLGRAMDCDVVIVDERVSPRHLRLFSSWRGVTVQDLSTARSVRLNGKPLAGVCFIQAGDCISLGPFDIHVQALDG